MNVLLVYPKYPDTYWSFKHALRFISKKAAVPPLGLITVSAMLPKSWHKKLVDINIELLKKEDLIWADFVFISAMYVQRKSVIDILEICREQSVKIVAGGPLFTQDYMDYPTIDYFVLNEAEITIPAFLNDLHRNKLKRVYQTKSYADLLLTPVPDYHLLNVRAYASMNLQISRGCPFACDFCEITALLGHKVRMKDKQQILNELEVLYDLNWRGSIAIVDDNIIGNKNIVKNDLLPAITSWMQDHKYPFVFSAQTSINIADDKDLLHSLSRAGFTSTFIGIETPVEESLHSCHKIQNENRDLLENVKLIQNSGLQVSGGFIVGFDSDTETVFEHQIEFIQKSGIVSAMVGLLHAPKNTRLYKQLEKENRLVEDSTGNNTDFTMNFNPKMNNQELLKGYQYIISSIYKERPFYKRARAFLKNYKPVRLGKSKVEISKIKALFKSIFILGLIKKGRYEYWKFFVWTLFTKPKLLIEGITMAIYGYHYRTVYGLK